MRILPICNILQLKNTIRVLSRGGNKLCFNRSFQGKFSALCQANFRFHSRHNEAGQFTNRLCQERSTMRRRPPPRFAMAMEKMEITDEQVFQEKQRVEQEETFLGKSPSIPASHLLTLPRYLLLAKILKRLPDFKAPKNGLQEELSEVVDADSDEAGPKIVAVGSEFKECWDLWQRIGLPVEKIAKQRRMTETGVFYCIFTCIQNNYTVDWYELCKEADFTLDIAKKMVQATEKIVANTNGGLVDVRALRRHLTADVSEVHLGLFATMLFRGLPLETIKEVSFQTGGSKPEMEWGEAYADEERFPKEVTENRLLQWFAEKDGASLIEIALKFRECDDLELMRIILTLEANGNIFWRQGIFRVI